MQRCEIFRIEGLSPREAGFGSGLEGVDVGFVGSTGLATQGRAQRLSCFGRHDRACDDRKGHARRMSGLMRNAVADVGLRHLQDELPEFTAVARCIDLDDDP